MKFLVPFLSIVLASQFALAAKRTVVIDDDADASTTTTTIRHHNRDNNASVVRAITPEFGLALADMTAKDTSAKAGLAFGGAVDLFKFATDWTFEAGVQYRQMGTNLTNQSWTLNYISLPLAAKYFFQGERATGFFAKAGFIPGFNVAHSVSATDGTNSQDLKGVNGLDFGLLFGVGGKIALSTGTALVLEADYDRGITNAVDTPSNPTGVSINNTSFTFLTGVAINM